MAAKKENKMTGYLVISIIPIIGIIWAGIEGTVHSSYVKKAIEAEDVFEKHFVEKLNATEYKDADGNVIVVPEIESANIVSIVLKPQAAKLASDPYPSTSEAVVSYTVQIGADLLVPSSEQELSEKSYKLVYEFFVPFNIYSDIANNFDMDKIGIYGEADYTYLTYYDYNPKNAPIYKLAEHFDQCYTNVLLFSYENVTLINYGGSGSVIQLINEIGEVELSDKELLSKIAASYGRLTDEEKSEVDNYAVYEAAVFKLAVLEVEDMITKLPEFSAFWTDTYPTPYQGAKNEYDKIYKLIKNFSAEQLASMQEDLLAKYYELENLSFALQVSYQLGKVDLEQLSAQSQIKKCVDLYNKLTVEQKAILDTYEPEAYNTLVDYVVIYNDGKEEDKQIKLEGKDE